MQSGIDDNKIGKARYQGKFLGIRTKGLVPKLPRHGQSPDRNIYAYKQKGHLLKICVHVAWSAADIHNNFARPRPGHSNPPVFEFGASMAELQIGLSPVAMIEIVAVC